MKNFTSRAHGACNVLLVASVALSSTGCGMFANYGRGRRNNSSNNEQASASGPQQLRNDTSYSICSVDVYANGDVKFRTIDLSSSPVEQGGTAMLDMPSRVYALRVMECGNESVLWDSYTPRDNRNTVQFVPNGSVIVLTEASSSDGQTLTLERTPLSAYLRDPGDFQGEYGDAVLQTAQSWRERRNYSEQMVAATVHTSEWQIARHRQTGVVTYRWFTAEIGQQWPDGHCSTQVMNIMQQSDGDEFVSDLSTNGFDASTQAQVPCAALQGMATH